MISEIHIYRSADMIGTEVEGNEYEAESPAALFALVRRKETARVSNQFREALRQWLVENPGGPNRPGRQIGPGSVVRHPELAGVTYTIGGKRGRPPRWVTELFGSMKRQEVVDDKKGTVLVNPEDPNKTYTVGQRGRVPAWAVPLL